MSHLAYKGRPCVLPDGHPKRHLTAEGQQGRREQAERALLRAKQKTPPGSTYGNWTTVGEVSFQDSWGTRTERIAVVQCRCTCGRVRDVKQTRLLHGLSTCCSVSRHPTERTLEAHKRRRGRPLKPSGGRWLGADHPRRPFKLHALFPSRTCVFVRCPTPTKTDDRWHVDHDHRCERHGDRLACLQCVRGPVHVACNIEIGRWDWARENGLNVPTDIIQYQDAHPLASSNPGRWYPDSIQGLA